MKEAAAAPRRLPPRMIVILFGLIFAALAAAYYILLQPGYAPLFTQIRASDASAILAQLDAKGVPHRLSEGGTAVLVPENRLDDARVIIAGSDIPTKGAVGFELFNKSDMGLTDFAQKINYQRALQGELERTILMTDGVERARVHLAMPERSLFRSDKSVPKAAVEVVPAWGAQLDEAKVGGIQRLVASAVPDLAPTDVTILGGDGRVLSRVPDTAEEMLSPAAEQRQAVERYYRARARAAVIQAKPGLRVDVKVEAQPRGFDQFTDDDEVAAPADAVPPRRDFSLRIVLVTATPLNEEDAGILRDTVTAATELDSSMGDSLLFRVAASSAESSGFSAHSSAGRGTIYAAEPRTHLPRGTVWVGLIAALVAAMVFVARRRGAGGRLNVTERHAFVARLRAALNGADEHVAS